MGGVPLRVSLAVVGLLAPPAAIGAHELLQPLGRQSARPAAARLRVLRTREVRVRFDRVPGASVRDAARGILPPARQRLVLRLFDDVVVRAQMTRSERDGRVFSWVGRIEGQPLGRVVLSVYDGILAGSIVSPRGAYRIAYDGATHVVEELDPSAFLDDNCFREAPVVEASAVAAEVLPAVDDGSTIDVLVVYTPAARLAAGGTSGMLSQINLAITETNTGYQSSGVVQRLRLVGASEISYTEAGNIGVDLDRVTCPKDQVCAGAVLDPDGYLDGVQVLRESTRADLVSLITQTPGSPYCGIAWLMGGNSPGFAPTAYSVVERSCMTGYYSFGHELGHNMGLNHARTDPVGTGAYSYSYGYKDPGHAFRTVMAYDCPVSCTRILHFSNPGVTYGGQVTGVSETSPSSAHNALSLNNTRTTVANWRGSNTVGVRVTAPNGGERWSAGSSRAVTWTGTALPAGAVVHLGLTGLTGRTTLIATVAAGLGSYAWTVPEAAGASWRVKACVDAAPSKVSLRTRGSPSPACLASDTSDAPFAITP